MNKPKLWNSNYLKIWTGNALLHLAFTLIVPLLPLYLSETYGADKQTIGLCLAGYAVMSLVVRPFSGFIVDAFPRKAVLIIFNFFFCATFVGYLASASLAMFTIFRTLHGLPFGATTVSASTVSIDVLPTERRTEGIGYYGLSNNLATAIGPVLAIMMLGWFHGNFQILFAFALVVSLIGLVLNATIKLPARDFVPDKKVMSLDRFFLLEGWREAISVLTFGMSYGVVTTYVAIYGKESLQMQSGTGVFFTLFALGLIVSRLTAAPALRKNLVGRNAVIGVLFAACGYLVFAALQNPVGYFSAAFIIGMGNGHMYPAFQTMFINLAPNNKRGTANSSILTSWDAGSGLGVLLGGVLSEHFGYSSAFWFAFAVNAAGMLYYLLFTKSHFEKNRLR